MARRPAATTAAKPRRGAQIRQAYTMTRRVDRWIGVVLLAIFLGVVAVVVGLGLLVGQPVLAAVLGVLLGILAATIVFGRRAERAAFSQVEGQPGAAAAALNMLRRGWTVTPGVAATRNQDVVHRVVGRPGVVLVSEGPASRVVNLLAAEKKKVSRYLPETPVYEVQVGDDEGQVPLRKVAGHVMKLPRNLRPAQVDEVNRRLKALGNVALPIPKGPLPKGAKMPKMPRPPRG